MGKRDQREVLSYLQRLILHLLKWQLQPEKRTASWGSSIINSREQLEVIFQQSPSLKRFASESFHEVYPGALRRARIETGLPADAFPAQCPYSFEKLLNPDYLPEK